MFEFINQLKINPKFKEPVVKFEKWPRIKMADTKLVLLLIFVVIICISAYAFLPTLCELCNVSEHFDELKKHEKGTQFYLSLLTFIIAAFSILFAYYQFNLAKSTIEAQVILHFNSIYANSELLKHLQTLGAFYKNPANKVFITAKRDKASNLLKPLNIDTNNDFHWSPEVNEARRVLKNYFFDILELRKTNYISNGIFNRACAKSGITLLFEVVEPLEEYLNPSYDYSKFYYMMRFLDKKEFAAMSDSSPAASHIKRVREVENQAKVDLDDKNTAAVDVSTAAGNNKGQSSDAPAKIHLDLLTPTSSNNVEIRAYTEIKVNSEDASGDD